MWWDDDTIQRTVTRQFVCSQLLPEDVERLGRPPGFGDALTDGTYWEWIDEKAKHLFLILVDLGLADQIFALIDDSWDDSDLPIALDQVDRLELTPYTDARFEKKFYYRQFYYLLKPLNQGDHVLYDDMDVVPMDIVDGKKSLTQTRYVDKVVLPNQPGAVFIRRCIPLGSGPGCISYDDFLYWVNDMMRVQNEHLSSYWASYVHEGWGYILFTPASEYSLKSLLSTTPVSVKMLEKQARSHLVLNWIHCLVDALCFVHHRNLAHGNIRPSTVLFTGGNHVFYSDITHLGAERSPTRGDKASFDKESYDYIAPEQRLRTKATTTSPINRKSSLVSPSSPPSDMTFSISRRGTQHFSSSATVTTHEPTPHLNGQAADIFSLGCVILELISFLMKKPSRAFASHRAAKHKTPGRGGAVPDSSFHKNLGQVESWMAQLAKEAAKKMKKKDNDDYRDFAAGVGPMLHVVERMLSVHPSERPSAIEVQAHMYEIIRDCGVVEPHCVHRYGGWDFGFDALDLSPTAEEEEEEDDVFETMSVATGRTTSTHSLNYGRTSSHGSGSARSSARGSGSASVVGPSGSTGSVRSVESRRERPKTVNLSSGFQAIRNLRLKTDKTKQWQSSPPPVYV